MNILEVQNVKKIYGTNKIKTEALSNVNFSVLKGEFIAIMGESGSGKTTLLNILSTFDKTTEGNILINGKNINLLKESEVAAFRRVELGFVFQDFNLLESFSNRDNIYLPLVLSGININEINNRMEKIKDKLGIADLLDKYPYEISGGQKQRVAIARAIITNPSLLFADEPTGALDSSSSEMILQLFSSINRGGQTILMVTHSIRAASYASRVLFIKDGFVYHELYKGNSSTTEFMERISQAQTLLNKRGE